MLLSLFCGATVYIFLFLLSEWKEYCGINIPSPAASWLFATLREAGGCCVLLFLFFFIFCSLAVVFACCFSTHPLTDPRSVTAVSVSCFCGPHRKRWDEERMLRWRCWLCVSLQRCCIVLQGSWMQHQNWWIDTRWRRGQRGLNASAKVFICRKVGHQSSLTSALLQSPKKMPVALIFPFIAIARLFNLCTLCAYDH